MTEMETPRRTRAADYTSGEISLIINEFVENSDVLLLTSGKQSDHMAKARRQAALDIVVERLNRISNVERSRESVAEKWQTIKKYVKAKATRVIREMPCGEPGEGETDSELQAGWIDTVRKTLTEEEYKVLELIPREKLEDASKNSYYGVTYPKLEPSPHMKIELDHDGDEDDCAQDIQQTLDRDIKPSIHELVQETVLPTRTRKRRSRKRKRPIRHMPEVEQIEGPHVPGRVSLQLDLDSGPELTAGDYYKKMVRLEGEKVRLERERLDMDRERLQYQRMAFDVQTAYYQLKMKYLHSQMAYLGAIGDEQQPPMASNYGQPSACYNGQPSESYNGEPSAPSYTCQTPTAYNDQVSVPYNGMASNDGLASMSPGEQSITP